jgi:hypothetical protein
VSFVSRSINMNLSRKTIKHIGKLVTGNGDYSPYRSGPKLVDFFVEFGANDFYGDGFPSRWQYVEDKLVEFNGSSTIRAIIEASLDPRDYKESGLNLEAAVTNVNETLAFDGFEVKKNGHRYSVIDASGIMVAAVAVEETDHERVKKQIEKAQDKINSGDYDGAITNARTMLEEMMINIIDDNQEEPYKSNGDLTKMYKAVRKILNLDTSGEIPDTVLQILSGLTSITNGLAGFSNDFGDRHANKNIASKHHAKLAVNAAMTLADFLVDTKAYQEAKSEDKKSKEATDVQYLKDIWD